MCLTYHRIKHKIQSIRTSDQSQIATTIKLETLTLKVLSHKIHQYILIIKHILNNKPDIIKLIFYLRSRPRR